MRAETLIPHGRHCTPPHHHLYIQRGALVAIHPQPHTPTPTEYNHAPSHTPLHPHRITQFTGAVAVLTNCLLMVLVSQELGPLVPPALRFLLDSTLGACNRWGMHNASAYTSKHARGQTNSSLAHVTTSETALSPSPPHTHTQHK